MIDVLCDPLRPVLTHSQLKVKVNNVQYCETANVTG